MLFWGAFNYVFDTFYGPFLYIGKNVIKSVLLVFLHASKVKFTEISYVGYMGYVNYMSYVHCVSYISYVRCVILVSYMFYVDYMGYENI